MDFSEQQLEEALQRKKIPERMQAGIIKWILIGQMPGHFLSAVIRNDLKEAIARADDENVIGLAAYIHFFYNHAPIGCWGSKEKVLQWEQNGGLRKVRCALQPIVEENDDGE
jgi:hypothetical protein